MNRFFTNAFAILFFSLPLFAADGDDNNAHVYNVEELDLNQSLDPDWVSAGEVHQNCGTATNINDPKKSPDKERTEKNPSKKMISLQERKFNFFNKVFPEYEEGEKVVLSENQFAEYIGFLSSFDDEDDLKNAIDSTREIVEDLESPHNVSFMKKLIKYDRHEFFLRAMYKAKIALKEINRDDHTDIAILLVNLAKSDDTRLLNYGFQIFSAAWTSLFIKNKIESLSKNLYRAADSDGKKEAVRKFLDDICLKTNKMPTSVRATNNLEKSLQEIKRNKKEEVRRREERSWEANKKRKETERKILESKRRREEERNRKEEERKQRHRHEEEIERPTSVYLNPAHFPELMPQYEAKSVSYPVYVHYMDLLSDDENNAND